VRTKSKVNFRHSVNVLRKDPSVPDTAGHPYVPLTVRKQVPCEVKVTGGRESEVGRQNTAIVTYSVSLYQAANKPITPDCWLEWKQGGTTHKLQIELIPPLSHEDDISELICTEEVGR
jgi:hypothetical protein